MRQSSWLGKPRFCRCLSSTLILQQHNAAKAISSGIKTPFPEESPSKTCAGTPFYFGTGYALFAKRPSKPFPPPFTSPPSGSFSDPLSTHNRNCDRRNYVNGEMIRGITNGDDAVLVNENFIGANDGVGAWASRPKGHAAYGLSRRLNMYFILIDTRLWSRLILHFWALEAEKEALARTDNSSSSEPDPISCLQRAYEQTLTATTMANEWQGTTTTCSALLHHTKAASTINPVLYVTNLGDSQIMVIRPKTDQVIYKTTEQWHWFDCPRQLGTNSPDKPSANAVMAKVELEEDDVVLAMSDGVTDNLWEHEIVQNVIDSIRSQGPGFKDQSASSMLPDGEGNSMLCVAKQLVRAARVIAEDPFAESPFMERAVEEGLALEGGKFVFRPFEA